MIGSYLRLVIISKIFPKIFSFHNWTSVYIQKILFIRFLSNN